ncbi:MAG: acylphosphatase [Lentimicrobium sp.]|jgi:acylphosphatase|nr:acylphosphatase [Lentimicrobium sp.]
MIRDVGIFVYGRVQGVGFRYFVKQTAQKYGISGLVKNKRDGGVYISATGESENLDMFIEACRKGPIRAVIIKFSIIESTVISDYTKSFKIL